MRKNGLIKKNDLAYFQRYNKCLNQLIDLKL